MTHMSFQHRHAPEHNPVALSPEMAIYDRDPASYGKTAAMIDLLMWIGDQRCTGGRDCEGPDFSCKRHDNITAIASRYARRFGRGR